jgi:hypothetical protein
MALQQASLSGPRATAIIIIESGRQPAALTGATGVTKVAADVQKEERKTS